MTESKKKTTTDQVDVNNEAQDNQVNEVIAQETTEVQAETKAEVADEPEAELVEKTEENQSPEAKLSQKLK